MQFLDLLDDPSFTDWLRIRAILGKLHHDVPAIHITSIKPIYSLLSLISVFVPHKRETPRVSSPPIPRYEDVDDLAVAVEERVEVVGRGSEANVEDEEREGVADVRRARPPEVRHRAAASSADDGEA